MDRKRLSRRDFLRIGALTAAGVALGGCAQPTPETEVVEVEVTRIVEGTPVVEIEEVEVPVEVTREVPAAPEETVIEFWNGIGPPEGVLMQDLMNRFEDSQTEVKIEQWTTEWEAFYTKIRTTYAEGVGPDLAVTHPRYQARYGGTVFQPIDDLVDADPEIDSSMFSGSAWEACFYEGKQYALPIDIHMFALYCNVGLFEAAGLDLPKTENELVEAAKALTEAPDQWGLFTRYSGGGLFWEWLGYLAHRGQKGVLSEDGTKAAFNNDAGIGALQRMYDNIYTDKTGWGPVEGLDSYQAFMSQTCAMRNGGTWEKFAWDTIQDLRYTSIMFMPEEPGTWGSSHLFVFPQMGTDEATQGAWDAAKFILKNFSVEWGVRGGHVPALLEAAEDPEYTGLKEMQGFRDSVPYIVYLPRVPQHEEVSEAIIGNLNAAMGGEKGIEEALNDAASKVNDILGA